jgi:peptide/nickel transport system permease protein
LVTDDASIGPRWPLARFIGRRVALGFVTLLLVSIVVFGATQVLPGNAATAILGKTATPARLLAVERQLHLNDSIPAQYWHWFSNIVKGDAGISLASQEPVTTLLSTRIENSAFLVLVSGLIAIPLSLAVGTLAAVRRDRPIDHVIGISTLVLAALPEFVIGILLVLLFATTVFQWLPSVSLLAPNQPAWQDPRVVVLPVATLVLAVMPYISRIMRGSMVEVLESEYVQMARLNGLRGRIVILRHAIPNAIVPAVQVTGLQLAWMAGGIVLVEYVFSYPGTGSALIDAVSNRDITVIQAITLLIAAFYVALNLTADLISIVLTPRLRTGLS